MESEQNYTAFKGHAMIASGTLDKVLPELKKRFDADKSAMMLVFDDSSGRQVDFDLRGTEAQVLARALPAQRTGPGRPKLGVVSREISLLPRHWEWLEEQPSGASAALRRLVDEARRREQGRQRVRLALDAAARFMSAMAGDLADFEEATRALYAKDRARLESLTGKWPRDIRKHMLNLIGDAI
jgi:uncharacterized protein